MEFERKTSGKAVNRLPTRVAIRKILRQTRFRYVAVPTGGAEHDPLSNYRTDRSESS